LHKNQTIFHDRKCEALWQRFYRLKNNNKLPSDLEDVSGIHPDLNNEPPNDKSSLSPELNGKDSTIQLLQEAQDNLSSTGQTTCDNNDDDGIFRRELDGGDHLMEDETLETGDSLQTVMDIPITDVDPPRKKYQRPAKIHIVEQYTHEHDRGKTALIAVDICLYGFVNCCIVFCCCHSQQLIHAFVRQS
jgi:hypothetical protein